MSTRLLPIPSQLRPILLSLLGKEVTITPGVAVDPSLMRLDNYVGDDNTVHYVVGASKEFAAYSGAALAMLPAGRAQDAIKSGDDDMLEMAYHEVLNVLSRAINDMGGAHVRLPVGEHFETPALDPAHGQGYSVEIAGYGTGLMGIWGV